MGIVPGKTSIQQVYEKFSQIADFEDQTRNVDTYQRIALATKVPPNEFVGPLHDNRWGFSMRVNGGIVIGMAVDATSVEEFSVPSLSKFLTSFGKPEQIWVQEIETMSGSSDYEIILYYPSKGIFIRWRGESESIISQSSTSVTVRVCPQSLPTKDDTKRGLVPPHFYLFSATRNIPLDEIIKAHLSEDPGSSYQLLPSTELDKFYNLYLNPTTQECFPFTYSW
ncbi:MAG: hypothetical protein DWB48_08465 [Nitrosomonas sp.]|nr:hypothetical protein [Nitrosomonas sp.]